MRTYEMAVFFELTAFKWWGDPKPKIQYVKTTIRIKSEKDYESLQNLCLEITKDKYVSARVNRELDDLEDNVISEEEFFKRLSKAYLTMSF